MESASRVLKTVHWTIFALFNVRHVLFDSLLIIYYIINNQKFYLNTLLVGSNGIEPSTSRLSGVRSNHLSYEPIY